MLGLGMSGSQDCGTQGGLCPQPRLRHLPPTSQVQEPKEEGSPHLAVPGVYFTCPLTGAILRKDQRDARIREAILMVSARPAAGATPRSLEGLAAPAASPPGCAPVLC